MEFGREIARCRSESVFIKYLYFDLKNVMLSFKLVLSFLSAVSICKTLYMSLHRKFSCSLVIDGPDKNDPIKPTETR